jgi:predicted HicB family RNase H-like nuclease
MKLNMMQYKGYTAKIEYDDEDQLFYGNVLDLNDVITFSGASTAELLRGLEESVDAYLMYCKEKGRQPEKPFSGKVQLRLTADEHRDATVAAASCRLSLNQFFVWCIRRGIAEVTETRQEPALPKAEYTVYLASGIVEGRGYSFKQTSPTTDVLEDWGPAVRGVVSLPNKSSQIIREPGHVYPKA